jgi:outer membrane receptor protein involved in Fe transport
VNRRSILIAAGLVVVVGSATTGQTPSRPASDTSRAALLNAIVVTAERGASSVGSSVSAVTRVSSAELARMPSATLADVLRTVPGFAVIDFDGLGFDPQIMVRGFYGGGEAEYVVVLVDGKPVNQIHSGVVAWDALPPIASIDAIEIVRGGGSASYGDAAIAGVINVITRGPTMTSRRPDVRWSAAAGSFGAIRASGDLRSPASWRELGLSGAIDRTNGFRDHARRTSGRARADVGVINSALTNVSVSAAAYWRDFDEPGPLLASLADANARASDVLFRFDHAHDRRQDLSIDGTRSVGTRTKLSGALMGQRRETNAMRTLALAPGFGDTKDRKAIEYRAAFSGQADIDDSPLPGRDRLSVGAEAGHSALDSKYYIVTGGPRSTYSTPAERRGMDTFAESERDAAAAFAQYSVNPTNAVRFSLGARFDHLSDAFESKLPSAPGTTTSHSAFSPKAGVNVQYQNSNRHTGNAYVAVSQSFKAPTLDQLYDKRTIPVPFPPFKITTSNSALRPQYASNVEAGIYQSATLTPGIQAALSLTAYETRMRDELDFDVANFRYVNIGRSRHRGVEAGANLEASRASAFMSYALQAATSQSGDFSGKQLKAIPRHSVTGGGSLRARFGEVSLSASRFGTAYLDDANTRTLPSYTRVDGRVLVRARGHALFADVRNLFDAKYNSSGFMDPSGSAQVYYYPAAGRVLEIGVRRGF